MTNPIKKIIARERLIIIGGIVGLLLLSTLIFLFTRNSKWFSLIVLIFYLYPIYLLIRFIIWAVRMLRWEKTKKLVTNAFENIKKDETGHSIIKLKCPQCSFTGVVTHIKKDFKILGKDEEGYMYFECPNCKKHLKYDSLKNNIALSSR